MLSDFWTFLEAQPTLTSFLVISLGCAFGEVSVAGFKLGVGAVLFVGLCLGAFVHDAAPPAILSTVGLIMFCYGIGIQHGKDFFEGLNSPKGQRQILIGTASTIGTGIVVAILVSPLDISIEITTGIFSGVLVSTATLESVVSALGSEVSIVGYGVAYPFGVFGLILFILLLLRTLRPVVKTSKVSGIQGTELTVSNRSIVARTLSEVGMKFSPEIQVIAIGRNGRNLSSHG